MQTFIGSLLLLALPLLTSAKCWNHDFKNDPNKQFAYGYVDVACSSMVGNYLKGTVRNMCASDTSIGAEWYYAVTRKNSDGGPLTADECTAGLRQEIDKCGQGGHHESDNFEFS